MGNNYAIDPRIHFDRLEGFTMVAWSLPIFSVIPEWSSIAALQTYTPA